MTGEVPPSFPLFFHLKIPMTDNYRFHDLDPKLESVIRYQDAIGTGKLLFVFADDTPDLIDCLAALPGKMAVPLTPLFFKRHELAYLSIPFPTFFGEFHEAEWAQRGELLYGQDVRDEMPAFQWTPARLHFHLEFVIDRFRSEFLQVITLRRPVAKMLSSSLISLMLSALLVERKPRWTVEDIFAWFRTVATPALAAIVDQWESLYGNAGENSGSDETNFQAAWLFEQFLSELQVWNDQRFSRSRERFVCRDGRLVAAQAPVDLELFSVRTGLNIPSAADRRPPDGRYWEVTEEALSGLSRFPGVTCAMLFGSLARGEICAGRSDLLDAYVALEDDCLRDHERFMSVFGAMVGSCRTLVDSGVPFHPFKYLSIGELTCFHPPLLLPEWGDDSCSRVLFGSDIRKQVASSAVGVESSLRMIHALPIIARQFAQCLHERPRTDDRDLDFSYWALKTSTKILARWVCSFHGIWATSKVSLQTLPSIAPQADLSVLHEVPGLLAGQPDLRQLTQALRSTLLLAEELFEPINLQPEMAVTGQQ